MMPVFLGQSKVGRPHVVEQAGGLALRMDRWKFMEPSKRPKMNVNTNTELGNDTVPQLYNLADDPGETRNVAAQHPARVREMTTLLGMIRKGATRTSLP
jgi:arylsulfatase A-like enzyme